MKPVPGCTATAGRGDLVRPADSGDRLVGDGFGHVELTFGDHVCDHRYLDRAKTDALIRIPRGAFSNAALWSA